MTQVKGTLDKAEENMNELIFEVRRNSPEYVMERKRKKGEHRKKG